MMRVYIGTALDNASEQNKLRDYLQAKAGIAQTFDWTLWGKVKWDRSLLRYVSDHEMHGVEQADAVIILLCPKYKQRGTHAELGAALVTHTPVVIVGPTDAFESGPTTCAFYHHPGVVEKVCHDGPLTDEVMDKVLEALRTWVKK